MLVSSTMVDKSKYIPLLRVPQRPLWLKPFMEFESPIAHPISGPVVCLRMCSALFADCYNPFITFERKFIHS